MNPGCRCGLERRPSSHRHARSKSRCHGPLSDDTLSNIVFLGNPSCCGRSCRETRTERRLVFHGRRCWKIRGRRRVLLGISFNCGCGAFLDTVARPICRRVDLRDSRRLRGGSASGHSQRKLANRSMAGNILDVRLFRSTEGFFSHNHRPEFFPSQIKLTR